MSSKNSCQFLTGFETGSLDEMTYGAGSATWLSVQSAVKKHGTYALLFNKTADAGTNHYRYESYTAQQTTVGIGFWVQIATRPASGLMPMFGSMDLNGYVAIDSDGKIRLCDGGGNPHATSTQVLTNDTWYWISLKIAHPAVGIDGEVKIYSAAGALLDTISDNYNKLSSTETAVFVGTVSLIDVGAKYYLDSGYCSANDHPPICPTVVALVPSGTGTQGDGWGQYPDSASKYQKVDEAPPNDATDYVLEVYVDSGVSTGMTNTTLTDTGKVWATNVWTGGSATVLEGGVYHVLTITSNTPTILTGTWNPHIPTDTTQDYSLYKEATVQSFAHTDCGLAAGTNILAVTALFRAATKTTDDILYSYIYDGTSTGGAALAWATTTWKWMNRYVSSTKPSGGEWAIASIDAFQSCMLYYVIVGDELRVSTVCYQVAYGLDPAATLTGTCVPTSTEAQIVAGGRTIIVTLTGGETWVAAGTTFNAQRQNIINGLDSAQSEAHGWDVEVKGKEVVGAVVRTSDTVVTITLSAQAAYDITATETITATIPGTAVVSGAAITATPTFTVTAVGLPAQTYGYVFG